MKRNLSTGVGIKPGKLPDHAVYYYLHENGELICKKQHYSWESFEESDFVRCWWIIDLKSYRDSFNMLFKAKTLGALPSRILELRDHWECNDLFTGVFCKESGIPFEFDDRTKLYSVKGKFTNQSLFDAVAEYLKDQADQTIDNDKV